jgi:hypothetical protein
MGLCMPPGALLSGLVATIFFTLSLLATFVTQRSGAIPKVDLDELWQEYSARRLAEGVPVMRTPQWDARQQTKQGSLAREARVLRLLALCALLVGLPLAFLLSSGRVICVSL